MITSLPHFKE